MSQEFVNTGSFTISTLLTFRHNPVPQKSDYLFAELIKSLMPFFWRYASEKQISNNPALWNF